MYACEMWCEVWIYGCCWEHNECNPDLTDAASVGMCLQTNSDLTLKRGTSTGLGVPTKQGLEGGGPSSRPTPPQPAGRHKQEQVRKAQQVQKAEEGTYRTRHPSSPSPARCPTPHDSRYPDASIFFRGPLASQDELRPKIAEESCCIAEH